MTRIVNRDFVELCMIHNTVVSQFSSNDKYNYIPIRIYRMNEFYILECSIVPVDTKTSNTIAYDTEIDPIFTGEPRLLEMEQQDTIQ